MSFMEQELYFLRSSEQYMAKDLLSYALSLDETEEELRDYPKLEQYERNYGSFSGDIGVYMIVDKKVAGGAWVRLLADGFGFVDHDTPELILAVKPEFRNRGIGRAVMQQLFLEVSKIFSQVSLCVQMDTPAFSLFERLGFETIEGSEGENGVGIPSIKMLKDLNKEMHSKPVKESKSLEEECFRKSFRPTS